MTIIYTMYLLNSSLLFKHDDATCVTVATKLDATKADEGQGEDILFSRRWSYFKRFLVASSKAHGMTIHHPYGW